MRAFRICDCCLLLLALLGILGCEQLGIVKVDPPKPYTLKITVTSVKCTVTPNDLKVHVNDMLTWNGPAGYSVQFNNGYSPVPAPVVLGQTQTVTGGNKCSKPVSNDPNCYFPYDVLKGDGTTCPDPGIHVIPNARLFFSKSQ